MYSFVEGLGILVFYFWEINQDCRIGELENTNRSYELKVEVGELGELILWEDKG